MAQESVIGRAARWLGSPAGVATLLGLAFVAISIWWRLTDQTVANGDEARHLGFARIFHDLLMAGHPSAPFRFEPVDGAIYPPLVYTIGALTQYLSNSLDAPAIALNIVFVPLLVAACYRVGSIAFDRRAGVLAVMFALAAPMTISQFHLFMLDMPVTAMVAAGVWLVLESGRFERPGVSAIAGVIVGLGLLTKQSYVLFFAPFAAVVLVRGGWRNWRGLALFCVAVLVVAGPWYLQHLDGLRRVADEATAQAPSAPAVTEPGGGAAAPTPIDHNPYGTEARRDSIENYAWYFWNFVNLQFLLPLALLYAGGLVVTAVRFARNRRPGDYAPELIVGALGSYLVTAFVLGFQDARYSIPGLIFVAVIGTGWLALARPPWRTVGTIAVAALLLVNTLSVNLGLLGQPTIWFDRLAAVSVVQEGGLRLFSNFGYLVGPPEENGRLDELLRAAKRDGVTTVGHEPITPHQLNPGGLALYGELEGLDVTTEYDGRKLGEKGIFVVYRTPRPSLGKPCARFDDGGGLYVFRGDPGRLDQNHPSLDLLKAENLYCPLR